jgi:RimJ/RimL family protein N-acetyltransferase
MSGAEIIQGENVSLRPPDNEDFAVLAQLRNDPTLQRQLMIEQRHHSSAQVRAWIRRRTGDPTGVFFVIDVDGARGFAQLTKIDRQQGTADLGICLTKSARGSGAATETMSLLEDFARQRLRCATITLRVLRINHRAIAFYRKAGFLDAAMERRSHNDDGRWRDVLFMKKSLA